VPYYTLAGVTSGGDVLAAFWNGADEEVVTLDPATAQPTFIGQLGNLHWWTDQFNYDSGATAYAVGQDVRFANYVYSYSLSDHRTTSVPLAVVDNVDGGTAEYVLGGVTRSGMLVAAYWTGVVYTIDPKTGLVSYAGTFDGLTNWQAQLAYDDATRTVYSIGSAGADFATNYLFSLNLDTGQKTRILLGAHDGGFVNYVLGGIKQDGSLVSAYSDGSVVRVIVIDPGTREVNLAGTFTGLTNWDNQLVYGGVRGTAFAYGNSRFYQVDVGR
jgi:hypothetical protein